MIRSSLIFLFLSVSLLGFGQSRSDNLIGFIYCDNAPVEYAAVSIKNSLNGTYSNSQGFFELGYNSPLDTLIINHVSYGRLEIVVKELRGDTIKLTQRTQILTEFNVKAKKVKYKTVSFSNKKREYNSFCATSGLIYVKKIEAQGNSAFLTSLEFYSSNMNPVPKRFALRIYQVDSVSGLPSVSVLDTNIIISVSKRKKKLKIDIASLNIPIDKSGLFVGLEYFGKTEHMKKGNTFCLIFSESENEYFTYYNRWGNGWVKSELQSPAYKPLNLKMSYKIKVPRRPLLGF